jgi:glucokinase
MSAVRLLADIGGTNIRLAWQPGPQAPLRDVQSLRCADHPALEGAIRHYLEGLGPPKPAEAALGIANPVTGDDVRMTNHGWAFSQKALQSALGLRRLLVINDFTALALALPHLPRALLRQVGGGLPEAGAPMALVGPGTGLGVSGLVFPPGMPQGVPLSGEGGHATLAAESGLESDVLSIIRRRHGHASAERAVSGPGLVEIYRALRLLGAQPEGAMTQPAEVTDLALGQGDACALQALELFCGFLGSVAGNLALTLGARGGVFVGGGIVNRLGLWFDGSAFRRRFEAKGRMQPYLAQIPCWVIDPGACSALLGAAIALDRLAVAGA